MQVDPKSVLSEGDCSRIVEMAWQDRIPFEAIKAQFGLNESAVIGLMRQQMKPSSFRMWRKRMTGRTTKHAVRCGFSITEREGTLERPLRRII